MAASIMIIAFSLVLLAYWFRYTCLLLLRNAQQDAGTGAPADARLGYQQVAEQLRLKPAELDPLQASLDRDYALLTYVLEHAVGLDMNPVERHLLSADYRLMGLWYRIIRIFSPEAARAALTEMATVVGVLSQRMGQSS